ncbi:hypothetical protein Q9R29_08470 [Rothia sp. ARF10]|nr:hypothetical protein [Rothia sp. ARF10]
MIPEATELPQALRLALLGHVHHLSWLVANVDVFGPARATQEAHALFGEITVATARVKRSRLPQWRDSLASMFAVLVFLNGLSDGTTDLLEAASDTVNAVTHLITATTDAVTTDAEQGPGQIEAPDREPKTPRDQT